jgi:hypothetical protein
VDPAAAVAEVARVAGITHRAARRHQFIHQLLAQGGGDVGIGRSPPPASDDDERVVRGCDVRGSHGETDLMVGRPLTIANAQGATIPAVGYLRRRQHGSAKTRCCTCREGKDPRRNRGGGDDILWIPLPVDWKGRLSGNTLTGAIWLRRGCEIAERVPRPMHLVKPVEKQRNCERRLRSRCLKTSERLP